ncbi:hypothetical protein D9M68_383520 [compost metagenome]
MAAINAPFAAMGRSYKNRCIDVTSAFPVILWWKTLRGFPPYASSVLVPLPQVGIAAPRAAMGQWPPVPAAAPP